MRGRVREVPSTSSLPKCVHQPELGQAKARSVLVFLMSNPQSFESLFYYR